jgi:uncharacterized protein
VRRIALLALVSVLAAAACGGEDESSAPTTTIAGEQTTTDEAAPAADEPETTTESEQTGPVAVIETAGGDEVTVRVEIADDEQERQLGLMNRESLPADAGMIFLFDGDVSGGFWMKDTLIPLSIAFAAADGTIQRILDMEPCTADPCDVYDPGVFYRSALEVNRGAFVDWGVAEGDRLTLQQ